MQKERILSLDLVRGFLLFIVIIDHVYRFPGFYNLFTGEGKLWVSAAEGFFLISGMLVGYIYGTNFLIRIKKTVTKLWKRSFMLYFWSILLTLLFTAWGRMLPTETVKAGLWTGSNLWQLLIESLTLKYIYGWADFLPYYSIFLALSPIALYLIAKGRWKLTLAISFIVWLFRGNNIYAAWQILFMVGIVAGYHLNTIENFVRNLSNFTRETMFKIIFSVTVATYIASHFFAFGIFGFTPGFAAFPELFMFLQDKVFNKGLMFPGRLALALIWFTTIYILFRKYENNIDKFTLGFFKLFGQNSLLVYIVHAFVLFPLNTILPDGTTTVENIFINTSVLVMIYSLTTIFSNFEVLVEIVELITFGRINKPALLALPIPWKKFYEISPEAE